MSNMTSYFLVVLNVWSIVHPSCPDCMVNRTPQLPQFYDKYDTRVTMVVQPKRQNSFPIQMSNRQPNRMANGKPQLSWLYGQLDTLVATVFNVNMTIQLPQLFGQKDISVALVEWTKDSIVALKETLVGLTAWPKGHPTVVALVVWPIRHPSCPGCMANKTPQLPQLYVQQETLLQLA